MALSPQQVREVCEQDLAEVLAAVSQQYRQLAAAVDGLASRISALDATNPAANLAALLISETMKAQSNADLHRVVRAAADFDRLVVAPAAASASGSSSGGQTAER